MDIKWSQWGYLYSNWISETCIHLSIYSATAKAATGTKVKAVDLRD